MRQPADVLDEVGRHLAGAVTAQSEGVDQGTETPVDRRDDLIMPADCSEEMGDVVRHLFRHLAPFPFAGQRVELVPEIPPSKVFDPTRRCRAVSYRFWRRAKMWTVDYNNGVCVAEQGIRTFGSS